MSRSREDEPPSSGSPTRSANSLSRRSRRPARVLGPIRRGVQHRHDVSARRDGEEAKAKAAKQARHLLPAGAPGCALALSDAKRHVDRVGKGKPVSGLKDERQAESFFQLDNNRAFITLDRHDIAGPDLSLHHIALGLQEQLDRAIEFGFRHSRTVTILAAQQSDDPLKGEGPPEHGVLPASWKERALVHNSRSRSIIALHPRDPRSRMTSFKRTQRKDVQKAYRVRNWREYETGLRARGSLTVWLGLTDGKLANWNSPRPTRRKPGRQRKYSNHAIETTVTLGLVFGLASRQTEGFLRSLLTLLNLDNDVPDHSTISRRKARLGKVASYERRTVKPVHLRIDSSGLSVHVGQWRTPPKARDSRKLHLAVDEQPSDVVACELTSKRARDASRVASLVGQIERPIASAKADAAYDTGDVYQTLENHRAHRSPKVLIPPRKGAQLALDSAGTRQRNRNIRARSRGGKRKWYVASGYSRRSKVETTFHRYKAILGSAMRARGLASQRVEVRLGCKILNTITALGIPDGEMIG